MRLLATRHAPALAISLIPLIAGPIDPWPFTSAIAIGAAALYAEIRRTREGPVRGARARLIKQDVWAA